eukprot:TRINITY_DN24977_c0_g1_i1.p1 TRINITY_DN24977_c0_g1~~TRINITY_DN24977_c0_g1_i1.p1  ORF type:complete len:580 (+),score=59.92 TRINITY_DN24977_c0_g1_i1:69-1742(+)
MANPKQWLRLPNYSSMTKIKAYYGEEVAFFMDYVSFITRHLVPPAVLGLAYFVAVRTFVDKLDAGHIQIVLAIGAALWTAIIGQRFLNRSERLRQLWGVESEDRLDVTRRDWNPNKESSCCEFLINLAAVLYGALYIGTILGLMAYRKHRRETTKHTNHFQVIIEALVLTLVIRIGSKAWRKIAPLLVDSENIKSEEQYKRRLIVVLSSVKLLIAIFPFFVQCFLAKHLDIRCADSIEDAAHRVWHLPEGQTSFPAESLKILEHSFSYKSQSGKVCIFGCFPPDPLHVHPAARTNCEITTATNLQTFFIIQVVSDFIFLLIPILLVKYGVWFELRKVASQDGTSDDNSDVENRKLSCYSFLQWQAKCAKQTPYEYESWGGSLYEDFLEVMIGYAVVVCFGVVTPIMALYALIGNLISYRMRAFRFVWVTCRPFPRTMSGVSIFSDVFSAINTVAAILNVALVTFFLYPVRSWHGWQRLLLFLILEHGVIILRMTVDFLMPDVPQDVVDVVTYNSHFKARLQGNKKLRVPADETLDLSKLDLSLNPHGIELDSDSSSE